MGQYGARLAALDGVGYQDILQRYYANTDVGSLPAGSAVLVRLTTFDGADTIVVQENGELTTKAGPGSFHALRVRYLGANGFAVDGSTADAADCAGGSCRLAPSLQRNRTGNARRVGVTRERSHTHAPNLRTG